jgi:hypothetical protein
MKTPIEPSDIRKGDLIRIEGRTTADVDRGETAHEYRAIADNDRDGWSAGHFNWYLLDRPKPAVELPETPTLGWLTRPVGDSGSKTQLGYFHASEDVCGGADEVDSSGAYSDTFVKVSAFLRATAVPTEEWRALLAHHDQYHADREFCVPDDDPLCSLLAAVDKAGERA